jgi:hypothetical protein
LKVQRDIAIVAAEGNGDRGQAIAKGNPVI